MMFKDFLNSRLPIQSQAGANATKPGYVEFGYGQVEPNHLSAQRTGQIYAQLPAAADIEILEQGQFVKYDYAAGTGVGLVDFTGEGEWMLVYNEIKLYRDHPDGSKQWDCEFAMIKDDYQARIYSPYDHENAELEYKDWHRLNLTDEVNGETVNVREKPFTVDQYVTLDIEGQTVTIAGTRYAVTTATITDQEATAGVGTEGDPDYVPAQEAKTHEAKVFTYKTVQYELDENGTSKTKVPVDYTIEDVTKDVEDIYEWGFTNDPWRRLGIYHERKMPAGTQMVPRVFKTNVGDIFTTNMIAETDLSIGELLAPNAENFGILDKASASESDMKWQVVKVYTMPDNQRGVKIMRIA